MSSTPAAFPPAIDALLSKSRDIVKRARQKPQVYSQAAILLVPRRSTPSLGMTLTTLSWFVLRWKWLWIKWQCRLLWRSQQCGKHGMEMTRTHLFMEHTKTSLSSCQLLSQRTCVREKFLRSGARTVRCTVHTFNFGHIDTDSSQICPTLSSK